MKTIYKIITIFLVGMLSFVACTKDFEMTNTDPNKPLTVPSTLLAGDIIRNAINNSYSSFVGGDMGSCWAQHWAKVNYEDEERYKTRNSVIEDIVWKSMYEDVIADARSMELIAVKEGNNYSQGLAIIMQAYTYSFLTECFGMVPFSEAMQAGSGNFTPKYDLQQDIYNGIFDMLDKADSLLGTSTGSLNATTDIMYAGDHLKWRKFANSLKFRLLMRVSSKIDVAARLQDIASNRAIFTSKADEAKVIFLDANPNANPIYESIVYRSRFEYKINSVLVDMLVSLNDPRLPVYAKKNNAGVYRGKPSGIEEVPNSEYNYDNVSAIGTFYINPNLPGFFMSYSELQFLMAEAAQKGYITGNAATFYNKGIEASFDFNELGPEAYAAYVAQTSVAYNPTNGLRKIAEQNWLALYCQGIEAWTEWRRTGYPVLSPAIDAVVDEIPSRYQYPSIEQSLNVQSYRAAVTAQGADLLTTKIWWMQ